MTTLRVMEAITGQTQSVDYNHIVELINQARPLIFDFDYPIFDANYKAKLETKILYAFLMHEICVTPVPRWKLFLANRLNEIMPYYNQLYKSELIKLDQFGPLREEIIGSRNKKENNENNNVLHRDSTTDSSGNTTSSDDGTETSTGTTISNGTTNSTQALSDTPQSDMQNVIDKKYLTSAQATNNTDHNTTDNTTDGEYHKTGSGNYKNNSNNTDDSTDNRKEQKNADEAYGETRNRTRGESSATLLKELRETFLNIDKMIIDDLKECFFTIF